MIMRFHFFDSVRKLQAIVNEHFYWHAMNRTSIEARNLRMTSSRDGLLEAERITCMHKHA